MLKNKSTKKKHNINLSNDNLIFDKVVIIDDTEDKITNDKLDKITNDKNYPITMINDKIIEENNNNIFLKELLTKQLKNVNISKKLNYNDIKRISKFISSSIFDDTKCSLWNGYITNEKNQTKGTYINFYFNKKKIALHRLLYINYINDIDKNDYIKFCCNNKGKCCNIHHMKKYCYNKLINNNDNIKNNDKINDVNISINMDKNKLIIEF